MKLDAIIRAGLEGRLSPEVALARALLHGATLQALRQAVAAARDADNPRWQRMADLADRPSLDALPDFLRQAAELHAAQADTPQQMLAAIADGFDAAVAQAPEASVAAYSLGDPSILADATAELVNWLDRKGLIPPAGEEVLEIGCGTGRVAAALAARGLRVLALDIAPAMVAEARRRHAAQPGLDFAATDGAALPALEAGRFALVLAVDSFPYLFQASPVIAQRHIAQAATLLRPGGALVVLNLSYRADPRADLEDAARWARANDLRLQEAGTQPFSLWDGRAFIWMRYARPVQASAP